MAGEKPKTERFQGAIEAIGGRVMLQLAAGVLLVALTSGVATYYSTRQATAERMARVEERLTRVEDLRARADAREARLAVRLDAIGTKIDELRELLAATASNGRVADERWRRLRQDVDDLRSRIDRATPANGIPRARRD